ncbi:MAG: hypothetical protein PVJ39_20450 [Gammaproteobacteria bacterium]|jgi:hypothetical protein
MSHYITVIPIVLMLATNAVQAASAIAPEENIHYIAEHLVEAGQDARYFGIPGPAAAAPTDEWRPIVGVAGADYGNKLASARGGLLTLGVEHGWSPTTNYSLLAFYDRFNVYGDNSQNVLVSGPVRNLPLDIPEYAIFSSPGGYFTHSGLGLVVRHNGNNPSINGWSNEWGLLLERLSVNDFYMHYRLISGADAGAEGDIQYGGTNYFLTPFFGGQYRYHLSHRFLLLPRYSMGIPLPPGEMTTRITGPGIDVTADSSGGRNINVGDGFVTLGMGLRDRNTRLEVDLGSVLAFPTVERLTHQGIDTAIMLSVTWRGMD